MGKIKCSAVRCHGATCSQRVFMRYLLCTVCPFFWRICGKQRVSGSSCNTYNTLFAEKPNVEKTLPRCFLIDASAGFTFAGKCQAKKRLSGLHGKGHRPQHSGCKNAKLQERHSTTLCLSTSMFFENHAIKKI